MVPKMEINFEKYLIFSVKYCRSTHCNLRFDAIPTAWLIAGGGYFLPVDFPCGKMVGGIGYRMF